MGALDRITEGILEQARAEADEMLRLANLSADEILSQARTRQEEQALLLEETARQDCLDLMAFSRSADRRNRQLALLETRNRVIDKVIDAAKAAILGLKGDERLDFLFSLFRKNAQPLDGVVHLSPSDSKISDSFVGRCRQLYPGNTLELSLDLKESDSGFVIQYGNTLHNCLIDDIFESDRQSLRDAANEVLNE